MHSSIVNVSNIQGVNSAPTSPPIQVQTCCSFVAAQETILEGWLDVPPKASPIGSIQTKKRGQPLVPNLKRILMYMSGSAKIQAWPAT